MVISALIDRFFFFKHINCLLHYSNDIWCEHANNGQDEVLITPRSIHIYSTCHKMFPSMPCLYFCEWGDAMVHFQSDQLLYRENKRFSGYSLASSTTWKPYQDFSFSCDSNVQLCVISIFVKRDILILHILNHGKHEDEQVAQAGNPKWALFTQIQKF